MSFSAQIGKEKRRLECAIALVILGEEVLECTPIDAPTIYRYDMIFHF